VSHTEWDQRDNSATGRRLFASLLKQVKQSATRREEDEEEMICVYNKEALRQAQRADS
jgi:hypothetical protein